MHHDSKSARRTKNTTHSKFTTHSIFSTAGSFGWSLCTQPFGAEAPAASKESASSSHPCLGPGLRTWATLSAENSWVSLVHQRCPQLESRGPHTDPFRAAFSVFFREKGKETRQKRTRIFYPCRTPKIPGKERENAPKKQGINSSQGKKKTRNFKKTRKGRTGHFPGEAKIHFSDCEWGRQLHNQNSEIIKVTQKWLKSDFSGSAWKWLENDTKVTQKWLFGSSLLSHFWVTLIISEFWLCSCRPPQRIFSGYF